MDSKDARDYRTYRRGRSVRLGRECYSQEGALYFITVCCRNRKPQLSGDAAKVVFNIWREVFENSGYRAWCLVVMPDHLHAIVECIVGEHALGSVVGRAKTISSCRLRGRLNLQWQAKFHDHIVRDDEEDPKALAEYVVNNPVRAGLIDDWTKWPWTYTRDDLL